MGKSFHSRMGQRFTLEEMETGLLPSSIPAFVYITLLFDKAGAFPVVRRDFCACIQAI